tara:strand:+ start:3158 stop:4519 length:1362 start_codon:yes stop_codon:yes gene_type:complete
MEHRFTAEQRIQRAHVVMMDTKELRFFGALSLYGDINVGTDITATAATNGIDTVFNPEFVQTLDDKELMFVTTHEQLHKAYKHLIVWKHLRDEDALLTNMACDYVINLGLQDLDPKGEFMKMPTYKEGDKKGQPHGLIDEAYRDMNAQQIFDILKLKNKQPPKGKGGGGGGDGDPVDSPEDGDPVDSPKPPEGQKGQEGQGGIYSNEILEEADKMHDDHNYDEEEEKSVEELEEIAEELDRAIRQSIEVAGDDAGGFASKIKKLIEVKTPWQELLADFIHSVCKGNDITSYRRYNKRLIGSDILMPHTIGENIGDIVVAIDTSGSITQDNIDQFLSEVKVIIEDVMPDKVHLLYWDTNVATHEVYDENDYDTLTDATKPKGGGGTDPVCVVEYVESNILLDSDVECVLFLTDAYVGELPEDIWGQLNYPVMWAVCPDGHPSFNPRVGQVINLD